MSTRGSEVQSPPVELICPRHRTPLAPSASGASWSCADGGCDFPIVDHIPRFVAPDNYAAAFGLQWNRFARTQLDSYTGTDVSRQRLTRMLGGPLDALRGKLVLEAGCGAGRFTELLLSAGAFVVAVDLSLAVEANYRNCHRFPGYFACQADILSLPVGASQFDYVICPGVIQHTPDPEETITALSSHVKPGGVLVMDHYSRDYPITPSRRLLRAFLLRRSPAFSLRFCGAMTASLWPLHVASWRLRRVPIARSIAGRFTRWSPVVDHRYDFPQLSHRHLYEWALLDTHDMLTDRYKHLRSADELSEHLRCCGMVGIEAAYAGNGVEIRATKPHSPARTSA